MARVIDDPSLERPPAGHERATFPLPLFLSLSRYRGNPTSVVAHLPCIWKIEFSREEPITVHRWSKFPSSMTNILENLFKVKYSNEFWIRKTFYPQDPVVPWNVFLRSISRTKFNFPKRISLSRLIYERRRLEREYIRVNPVGGSK